MAFGYYGQSNYGSYIPQQYPQQNIATPSQGNTGIVWVQGEAGAKSYLMAPGNTALLMDSEASKMYIKTTDAAGMPSMRIFEYKEIQTVPQSVPQNATEFATKAEFEDLRQKIEDFMAKSEKSVKSKNTKQDGGAE